MEQNQDIRQLMNKKRLKHYEVAATLGVSEYTLCKWLRKKLEPECRKKIIDAIDETARELGL